MSTVASLTAVVLAKNEEKNIARCLNSLGFCQEIIVLDDESVDRTCEIATSLGARVVSHKLTADFSLQRNYAQDLASFDWILYIDADEEVSAQLEGELRELVCDQRRLNQFAGFFIKRRDFWWGKELQHGEISSARNKGFIRLIRKRSGHWQGMVHETFSASGPIGQIRHYLNHYPHPTIKDFLREINFYSTLRAKELKAAQIKSTIAEIILYPLGKFLWNYLIKRGYKDKAPGFAYAFFMSFHSFLVRAKLYQYWNITKD